MPTYGTRPTGGPWSITLRLAREPRCPGCCEWLQPEVVEIRAGWAWCPICINQALHTEVHLLFALTTDAILEQACVVRGINFYMPKAFLGEPKNALDYYEGCQLDRTDQAMAVTKPRMS